MRSHPLRPLNAAAMFALVVALGSAPQTARGAPEHAGGTSSAREAAAWYYGAAAAPEFGQSAHRVGPRLSAYALRPAAHLTPTVQLDVGVRLASAFHPLAPRFTGASYVFEAVPVARITRPVGDRLRPHVEYGIGAAWMRFTDDLAHSPAEGGQLPVIHCGAGVTLAASTNVRVLAEVRAHVYPKRGSNVFLAAPSLGVEFR